MKICIIGTGYVGLVTGVCFAQKGHHVTCLDIDEARVATLSSGTVPFYEPGLKELMTQTIATGRLKFTTNEADALRDGELCFVAVGTPMNENGAADLSQIRHAADMIGRALNRFCFLVVKSTVPVGTGDLMGQLVTCRMEERHLGHLAPEVISNPEFLQEGNAIETCMNPERVIIGARSEKARAIMTELYSSFITPEKLLFMDSASAEISKYAANAMLAARISFMNEMAQLCDRVGADINQVKRGIASDHRIGSYFLNAGCGYGGSCFPKDVQALCRLSEELGLAMPLITSIDAVNRRQKRHLSLMIQSRFGPSLPKRRIALLGLAFKPDTDDLREAPSLDLIEELTLQGATVTAFDPVIRSLKEPWNSRVSLASSVEEAITNADAAVLVTEWPLFASQDWPKLKKLMKTAVFIDGRNFFDADAFVDHGFEYYCIGRSRCVS